ncbi:phosphoribosyltransferase [Streptomyces telluris]|uniref:Phosphoribosyltransferase n=1 Tax=Streptomyces telluris TaxID=2720021 RepID=A0A9X2RN50_9ACTN|nr:phosphoribosyltransferase [Streptomyces telluris]MCQ8770056.1 phosphoribosyltransferase [Streptomyces telluris]NJP76478.1 phosphoribosyltransferase [Streptomyces telluris]
MSGGAGGEVWSGQWVAERLGVSLDGDARLPELLGLALRRNPKRAHLLVSNVLGKHVPAAPAAVYESGAGLGRRVRALLGEEEAARAVVLGYAETATGLGHAVADGLGLAPYLHSTRRAVAGVAPVGGFEEEHSHATSHLLLPEDPGLLEGDGPLVLVDDEFSTGRTVLNTIAALHARFPRGRYVVVALVDMRSEGDRARLEAFAEELGARVDLIALASGTVGLPEGVLERGQVLVAEQEAAASASVGVGAGAGASGVRRRGLRGGGPGPYIYGPVPGDAASPSSAPDPQIHVSAPDPRPCAPTTSRIDLPWPAGVPDGGRHGFTPEHRAKLEAALPEMAGRIASLLCAAVGNRPADTSVVGNRAAGAARVGTTRPADDHGDRTSRRILVLGNEELMYTPLRLAAALDEVLDGAEVLFSTTTRSPVLPVDDPGYAIRSRITFPAHDAPDDGPGDRYAYNVAGAGFDVVVVVVDSRGDTAGLHAPGGLLDAVAPHTGQVLLAVVPSYVPEVVSSMPEPLRGPAFSSYEPEDVGWLLQDLSGVELEAPTEEREEAIQSGGAHYAESLPVEYQPSEQYQALFHAALDASAGRMARAVGAVTELVLAERSPRPVLVSLARAGTPVGVLMRRWARHAHGLDLPHYAVSIVRGRGIDRVALRWLAEHHDPRDVVFVDGWTGKGAITRELAEALEEFEGFDPRIAVLADPGRCVDTYGTRDDFLIPSACLNSTVSGLVSRTVLRSDLVGPEDFHGAKFYAELAGADVSRAFLDAVTARFGEVEEDVARDAKELAAADRTPTWDGWAAVERISEEYGIHDVNLVKPGVGETTRVLLRRVPWKILAQRGTGEDLAHVRLLAEQRGVPVEEVDGLPYSCVGLIHPRYTRGATGADGKAVAK